VTIPRYAAQSDWVLSMILWDAAGNQFTPASSATAAATVTVQ
jgi:hypothetical protein